MYTLAEELELTSQVGSDYRAGVRPPTGPPTCPPRAGRSPGRACCVSVKEARVEKRLADGKNQ